MWRELKATAHVLNGIFVFYFRPVPECLGIHTGALAL